VPSKVYGIMAASRPFVAMMDRDSEVARLAERHDIGSVVRPGDDTALAVTIEQTGEPSRQSYANGSEGSPTSAETF
jgi:hypothetical protein